MTGDHSATLYVNRPLTNAGDIAAWAKAQGFSSMLAPDDMHVTIVFSKKSFNWQKFQPLQNNVIVPADSEKRSIEQFGDATVLTFSATQLAARHQFFEDKGASFDFPSYTPHLTISYDGAPEDFVLRRTFTRGNLNSARKNFPKSLTIGKIA